MSGPFAQNQMKRIREALTNATFTILNGQFDGRYGPAESTTNAFAAVWASFCRKAKHAGTDAYLSCGARWIHNQWKQQFDQASNIDLWYQSCYLQIEVDPYEDCFEVVRQVCSPLYEVLPVMGIMHGDDSDELLSEFKDIACELYYDRVTVRLVQHLQCVLYDDVIHIVRDYIACLELDLEDVEETQV